MHKNTGIARYLFVSTLSIFTLLICSLLSWHRITVLSQTFSINAYRISANAALRSMQWSASISSMLRCIMSISFWLNFRRLIISPSPSTIFVAAKRGEMPMFCAWSSTWWETAWIQRCTAPFSQKSFTFGVCFFSASFTMAAIKSSIPSSFAALIGITGTPNCADIFFTSIEPPFSRTSSIIFKASAIGMPISKSCKVK